MKRIEKGQKDNNYYWYLHYCIAMYVNSFAVLNMTNEKVINGVYISDINVSNLTKKNWNKIAGNH